MSIIRGLKNYFARCEHNNISKQLGEQRIVKEVFIWEKDNPEPVEHYYKLYCPDCGRPIAYDIEW